MNQEDDKTKYLRFQADLLNAHFNRNRSDEQLLEQLGELVHERNIYARQALEDTINEFQPMHARGSPFWKKLEEFGMRNVAHGSTKGTSDTDESGLWRYGSSYPQTPVTVTNPGKDKK